MKGKILWYNKKRGFGLILKDEKEFFFHHSQILGHKNINKNDLVDFEESFENEKLVGKKVKLIKKKRIKNTQNFTPSHKPTEMRVVIGNPDKEKFGKIMTTRDVTLVNGLFCNESDLSIYNKLMDEINKCNENKNLFKMWHGDSHYIVDDNLDWKKNCPTFTNILNKISDYFDMEIQATRFNWYENSDHWKPFHHDAAAIKPHIAAKQNFTVGVSFGLERDAAFEYTKDKTVISFPLPNGSIYCFAKDVNIMWKHGILQIPPSNKINKGRISIIAWGKNKQKEV